MPIEMSNKEIAKLVGGMCGSAVLPGTVAGIVTGTSGGTANEIVTAILASAGCGLLIVATGGICAFFCYKRYKPNNPNNVLQRDSDPKDAPAPPAVVIPLTMTIDARTPANSLSYPYPGSQIEPLECFADTSIFKPSSPRLSLSGRAPSQ